MSTTMYMSSAARLCAPLSNTSAVAASHFVDASACEPYCTLDDCHRCACRACSQCACTDRLGHPLPSGVCNQPREGEQVALGHAKTALDCRQACDDFDGNEYRWLDGYEYRPGKSSCTVWMHDASNGMCLGHLDAQTFEPDWALGRGLQAGLALCAAPTRLTAMSNHNSPRAAHRTTTAIASLTNTAARPLLVLHTVASYAVDHKVAARVARAHVALSRDGHVHRVVLATEVCLRQETCGGTSLAIARRSDEKAVSTIMAAVAQAMSGRAVTGAALSAAKDHQGERAGLVHRVGLSDVRRAFPLLLLTKHGQGFKWADRRRPKWLSNGCDLVGLSWLALHGRAMSGVTPHAHVWVLQHDVGWSGDLAAVLSADVFNSLAARIGPSHQLPNSAPHSAPKTNAPTSGLPAAALSPDLASPDLICLDLAEQNSSWVHSGARNGPHQKKYARQASCLIPAVRYSRRLISHLVEELREGLTTYCEARAATACASQPWCTAGELRGSGLLGPFSYFTLLNESAQIESREREANERQCAGGLGRLFHRVS